MKTLSEVIKSLESAHIQVETGNGLWVAYRDNDDLKADALQYLKWYKELADDSEAYVKWRENPPLDWETLKTMEGKPVWFEWTGSPRWGIVDGIYTNAYGVENLVICIPHDYLHFDKRMQGQVWQAYRKETE